jgi:hypothetical protein
MGRKRDTVRGRGGVGRGEAAPEKGKREDNTCWADMILTGPKNKENSRDRFSCYKWTVKI